MNKYLNQLGIELILLIGGVAGAIVALKKSNEPWYKSLSTISVGIIASVYLSPLLCSFLNITEDKFRMGIAFLIGYGGINLIDKILLRITKLLENGDTK